MDLNKLTLKTQEVLNSAQQIAMEKGHQTIETGHVLSSIFQEDKDVIPFLLNELKVNVEILQKATESILNGYPKVSGG